MAKKDRLYLGIDYGSDSVRCVVVDMNGGEIAHASSFYKRWKEGKYCDASHQQFRQHPLDYLESLDEAMAEVLEMCDRSRICGIGVDCTGSTPCLADNQGRPLALKPEFAENPDAMFVLWKDHTAEAEAKAITEYANANSVKYTDYCGTVYSSEWFWAKMLHVLRSDVRLQSAAYTFVEHCDFMVHELCGNYDVATWKRSQCAAWHKAMFHRAWGGLPPADFFAKFGKELLPYMQNLYSKTFTADQKAGVLSPYYQKKWGLNDNVTVACSALDAHMGALGAGIEYGIFVMIMGTSCPDMVLAKENIGLVPGICGQAEGSILPGMTTLEEGQSAFGDIYAWFKRLFDYCGGTSWDKLERDAAAVAPSLENPWTIDWHNGRRSPFDDASMRGLIGNLNLGTNVPMLYRSMVESTLFGTRRIVEHLRKFDVDINKVIASGGIALKSPFVMQMCADVLNMEIGVASSLECCARGSAIMAAAADGAYPDALTAKRAMQSPIGKVYTPDAKLTEIYNKLYSRYLHRCEIEESLKK
ncbi:MAG: ribulokinase [Lentisphaeria bacterium]|nr:ribulokinase [Lentisphaeria bacterium]